MFLLATVFDACLLNIPRSPLPDLYRANHSSINVPMLSGFVSYTAELFDKALCASTLYHSPDLASLISLSLRSDKLIIADRLTPPTTTISPTLQTRS